MKQRLQKSLYTLDWEILCRILKQVRKDKGLTQEKLAQMLGRRQNLIAKIEAGERKLDVCQLMDYLETMGADPVEVVAELVHQSKLGRAKARHGKGDS